MLNHLAPSRESISDTLATYGRDGVGRSPVVVLTGSGKYHVYYRHGGEPRLINRFPSHKIDLLGSGVCVAPPWIRPGGGAYTYIAGGIADLATLPTIRKEALAELGVHRQPSPHLPAPTSSVERAAPPGAIFNGESNTSMFLFARQQAVVAATLNDLLDAVRSFNGERCVPPLADEEVLRTAQSVWKYKSENRLWLPGATPHVAISQTTIKILQRDGNGDAALLLMVLNDAHQGRNVTFCVSPEGMARSRLIAAWDIKRYRRARDTLCRLGLL